MSFREERLIGMTDTDGDLVLAGTSSIIGRIVHVYTVPGDFTEGFTATLETIDHEMGRVFWRNTTAVTNRDNGIICGRVQLTVAGGGDAKRGGAIIIWSDE